MTHQPRLPSLLPLLAGLFLVVSCVIPLGWLAWQIAGNPQTFRLLHPNAIRWDILGRTCGFSAIAAILAGLLAVPAGVVVGSNRSRLAGLIALFLPLTLLLPSLMYAYGWAQFFRLLSVPLGRIFAALELSPQTLRDLGLSIALRDDGPHLFLTPAGPADVARCVFSLAAWLWPIPAAAMAWALRRADPVIRQQALLDGVAGRVMFRQVLPAAMVGMLAVWVLASQEFAVYEPTGVSVVATEVRMVFETGSFSSVVNPITAPIAGGMFGGPEIAPTSPGAVPPVLTTFDNPQDVQQRAAAAAVATGTPMLLLTALIGAVVAMVCRRWSAESDEVHEQAGWLASLSRGARGAGKGRTGGFTKRGDPRTAALALAVIVFTVAVPIVAMILRHQRSFDLPFMWREFDVYIVGSLFNAALAGMAAMVVAMGGLQRRPGLLTVIALASFLIGGQLLAIALIRLYNRQHLGWIYNAPPIMVMAYLGRFGWLALLAAGATWTRPWRLLRQQAALDGATPAAIAHRIVWPLAWPIVAGAGMLVLVLSLTEVPATVLVTPLRPPQIVPMLMTWVHTLESDPMIEASLLLGGVAMVLATAGVLLMKLGRSLEHVRSEGDIV